MHAETCAKLWYLFKTQKNIFFLFFFWPIFRHFFPPSLALKSYRFNFFSCSMTMKNWAVNMHFTLSLFSKAFFYGFFPRLYIDSDPPAFIRLNKVFFPVFMFILTSNIVFHSGRKTTFSLITLLKECQVSNSSCV